MANIAHPQVPYTSRDGAETTYLSALLKRTSWGAVIAGALVAISLQMIFTVLGIAVGVTASENLTPSYATDDRIKIGAAVWWLITGTAALVAGGMVVGRFAGMTRSPDVLLHALTMWAVTAVFGFAVVWSGAGMLFGSAAIMGGQDMLRIGGAAAESGTGTAAGLSSDTAVTTGDTAGSSTGRGPALTTAQRDAARYVRSASWWTLFALLLGIGASLAGSWATAPERIVVRPASTAVTGAGVI